ncbi:acylphosphatase-1 [Egretta garzetta]|nr:acylphosphatase-1 [Egretta garzetta]
MAEPQEGWVRATATVEPREGWSGLTSFCSALPSQGEAKRLGLVGWVQNTSHGTVQGQIQGPTARVRELQEWLRKVGSPQSCISRAEFSNEKKITALEHKDFQIWK